MIKPDKTVIRMREWSTTIFSPDHPLAKEVFSNHELEDLLYRLHESRVLGFERRRAGELRIMSKSFTGSFSLGNFRIDIRPKIRSDELIELFRYAFSLKSLVRMPSISLGEDLGLDELLREELCSQVQRLIMIGIRREYTQINEDLISPRGRIRFHHFATSAGIQKTTLPCSWFPRLTNSPLNQTILSGLEFAARSTNISKLRNSLQTTAAQLKASGIQSHPISRHLLNQVKLSINPLTKEYQPSLVLIEMLLAAESSLYLEENRDRIVKGFLFDMNRFFQRLLSKYLNDHLIGNYNIRDEAGLYGMFMYEEKGDVRRKRVGTPRPDFAVIKDKREVVAILDAKYRDIDARGPGREILYQLALYAVSQPVCMKQATILYPATSSHDEETIIIREPVSGKHIAKVITRPVDLKKINRLVQTGTENEKKDYAEYLSLGILRRCQTRIVGILGVKKNHC